MEIPLKTKIELELVHMDRNGKVIEIIKLNGEEDNNGNCGK
jgi:hypothetical protein